MNFSIEYCLFAVIIQIIIRVFPLLTVLANNAHERKMAITKHEYSRHQLENHSDPRAKKE